MSLCYHQALGPEIPILKIYRGVHPWWTGRNNNLTRLLCKIVKPGGDGRNKQPPTDQEKQKLAEDPFPEVDRCLIIIGGLEDDCSKRQQKVQLWEVCSIGSAVTRKLKWASTPIIFDQDDHLVTVP